MHYQQRIGIVLCLLFLVQTSNTIAASGQKISIMSWNVENLFDTINDPEKIDEEFTPEGRRQWTKEKLAAKMKNLAEIVTSIKSPGGRNCPDVLALIEIENSRVLKQWRDEFLASCDYKSILISDRDPDPRGIEVALLTRLSLAGRALSHPTYTGGRFILEARLRVGERPLTVFVNHWKSRIPSGKGEDSDVEKRKQSAEVIRKRLETLHEQDPEFDAVVVGDFNDEPEDESLRKTLRASANAQLVQDSEEAPHLWVSSTDLLSIRAIREQMESILDPKERAKFWAMARGSYFFHRNREFLAFDNILISRGLFIKEGFSYVPHSYRVIRHRSFIDHRKAPLKFSEIEDEETGEKRFVGASDHFPVLLNLAVSE